MPTIHRYMKHRSLPAFTFKDAVSAALAEDECSTNAHAILSNALCIGANDTLPDFMRIPNVGIAELRNRMRRLCNALETDESPLTLPEATPSQPIPRSKRSRNSEPNLMLLDNISTEPRSVIAKMRFKRMRLYQPTPDDFEAGGGLTRLQESDIDRFLALSTRMYSKFEIATELLPLIRKTSRSWPRFDLVIQHCGDRINY